MIDVKQLVGVLRALGDRNRLRVLAALASRPACVGELVRALKLKQPNLSRHLKVLEAAGLVTPRRDGPWVVYHLRPAPPVTPLLRYVRLVGRKDRVFRADAAALARTRLKPGPKKQPKK